ncbi:MAG: GntR family transcriptional regulator [Deltaproteobacteria bacterium]|nr:GntR family transcriptional regulator [Deltaproteobacteria bacterium]
MDNPSAKRKKLRIRPPVSIREKVYAVIRDDILSGRIAPGERLVETGLAKEINTSRTPVREALHLLEREGLLESIPRGGYYVKDIAWDEVEEICEIRIINETLAARWAMDRITPRQIEALEKNLAAATEDARGGAPISFVDLDAQFHDILVRASGSKRLYELCEVLRRNMLRYRLESLNSADVVLEAISGHRRILDCIREKNSACIEAAIRRHLDETKDSIRCHAFKDEK